MNEIRRLFDAATAAAKRRGVTRGVLGKPDGTIAVPARPTFVFVRVSSEGGQTITIARNPGAVANRLDLPVEMEKKEGVLVIIGVDGGGRYDQATANDTPNVYGVAPHTHSTTSGLAYEVESIRLEPGRVRPAGGFNVYINPFRYRLSTGWQTWPGGTLNLVASQPTDPDVQRWVVVGIDAATNSAVAVSGADEDAAATLSRELLDDIDIGDMIPCAAVAISDTDTNVDGFDRYLDAHGWFNDPRAALFDDTEGDPSDVATVELDGISLFAARRDHAHSIANATVTAAMLVDGAALAEILDDDGAGSLLDADLLDGVQGAGYSLIAHTHAYQPLDATLTSLAALGTAADKLPYTTGVDTWAETPFTAAGRAIVDDADATAQRVTLGLVIGTNVQAFDATLLSLATLGTAADKLAYTTGVDTWAETPLTTFGRSLIDDAAAVNGRATLGLIIGTDVQAFDAELAAIAGLVSAADRLPYFTGSGTASLATFTAAGRALIDDADATAQKVTLGLDSIATTGLVADSVTNTILANMVQDTVKGRALGAGTGDPTDLTVAQLNALVGSANLVMADTLRIETDEIRARDAGGLKIYDDGGTLGLFLEDGGDVGIGTASPAYKLDCIVPAGAQNIFRFGQTGLTNGYTIASDGARFIYSLLTGNVGIGMTAPQGILHTHDGTGGSLTVTKTAIDGTAQVLIPNAAGDVVVGCRATCVVKPSTGTAQTGTVEVLNGASSNIFNAGAGADVLTLRVNADGSCDCRRTAGTLTYTVAFHVVWL